MGSRPMDCTVRVISLTPVRRSRLNATPRNTQDDTARYIVEDRKAG